MSSNPCQEVNPERGRHRSIEEPIVARCRMLEIDPSFCTSRFRVTVGVEDSVFDEFAQAWREAGIPD